MAKQQTSFACQSCGAVYSKWAGKCEACHEWNSLVEEQVSGSAPVGGAKSGKATRGRRLEFEELNVEAKPVVRSATKITEFDRVTGGGLVPGSAVLIGGDPGVGKSTLLLQVTAQLANQGKTSVYISGEEAADQVRMRAKRLGLEKAPIKLASATRLQDIIASLDYAGSADFVVIDSIQTVYHEGLDSAPGTVSQVRGCAQELIRIAKQRGFALLLVGHVNKEGTIAGPKVLEHMVDAVIQFEGDRGHQFRILRAIKNRFGPADEIGVFEMGELGLREVANPSELFLAERETNVSGAAVFAGVEGTRPVLVEVQALVAPSPLGTPRRAVVGWDAGRLAMVLAVLEARCGIEIGANDVYLNVAGGLKIGEPAADMAMAAALMSSLFDKPLPNNSVVFGEIGLSGEVRAVSSREQRLKESAKLGFKSAFVPKNRRSGQTEKPELRIEGISHLSELARMLEAL
ncbi:MAG: DNA repair protein RadA [Alphaproteobacteria bacterium]